MELKDVVERLEKAENIYIVTNYRPNIPYIECDTADTMLDFVTVYFAEEPAKARAKELVDGGYGAKHVLAVRKDSFLSFFSDVIYFGIDGVRFITENDSILLETDKIVKIDMNAKDPNGNPYIYNPAAQVTMFYFVQEMLKKEEIRNKETIQELQTEVLAHTANAEFYVAFTELKPKNEEEAAGPKRFVPAVMKDPKGAYHLPIFTDMNEFKRSFQNTENKSIPYKAMPYREIMEKLMPDSSTLSGILINPRGVALPLERKQAKYLAKDPNFIR